MTKPATSPPGEQIFHFEAEFPLAVPLAGTGVGQCVQCSRVLRRLPGRRLVCAGRLAGRPVLVKIFRGERAGRDLRREVAGARALAQAGIDTPRLLEETRVRGRGWPLLLFEYLESATSLADVWEAAEEPERIRLLKQLLVMVAEQHEAGLQQRDMHLDNFLLDSEGRLQAIDAGGYRIGSRPLGLRASANNLGLLFAQLPRALLEGQVRLLEDYARARGRWSGGMLLPRVRHAADRWRSWRARNLGRKAFRNCTEFLVRRSGSLHLWHRRELEPGTLDQWIAQGGLEPPGDCGLLKAGNSQTVWATRLAGEEVVVKRYNQLGWWQILRRSVGGSRAARAWRNAHWLRALHIDTPRPLAMIEERRGPLCLRAWLVTGRASGAPAHEALAGPGGGPRLEAVVGVVRALAGHGLVHGDLKASNFIVAGERVQLIDLDSLSWPRLAWWRKRGSARDLRRFLRNWPEGPLRSEVRKRLSASVDVSVVRGS